jgi:hypothetical protein
MDHERAAADRGAVDPFQGQARITRDRDRHLTRGRDATRANQGSSVDTDQTDAAERCFFCLDSTRFLATLGMKLLPVGSTLLEVRRCHLLAR